VIGRGSVPRLAPVGPPPSVSWAARPWRTAGRARAAALVAVLLSVGAVIVVTDTRGRSEVRDTTADAVSLRRLEASEAALLVEARARTWVVSTQDWSHQASLAKVRASLATTGAANTATAAALAAADYDIGALETCLAGANRALDQLAVGQPSGALSSLSAVSSSCNAARPGNG